MKIKISVKSLNQKFHPCTEDYIKNVCKGRCCQGTGRTMITVHPSETEKVQNLGAIVENNFIVPLKSGLCPFKSKETGLCSLHYDNKPFGCKASPFTLSKNDVLIVRNRYRMLKCYKDKSEQLPAYINFYLSLKTIFGEDTANKIKVEMLVAKEDFYVETTNEIYQMLKDNDKFKHDKS